MKPRLFILSFVVISRLVHAEDTIDAAAIFDRVKQKYASCGTYSCEGTFQRTSSRTVDNPVPKNDDRTFLVRFARPDKFRVDWTESGTVGLGQEVSSIYTENGSIFSYSATLRGPERRQSIKHAIGVEAGVSGGISYLIPSLLIGGPGYLHFWTITRGPDCTVDGKDCYSISLETKGFGFSLFEVVKSDFAIARVTNDSDAAVIKAQRERAHRENSRWFADLPGLAKPSISTKTITEFRNVTFDTPIDAKEFKYTWKKDS